MFKVILEMATGEFSIARRTFSNPPGYFTTFSGSKPACKAWIEGYSDGRRSLSKK